MGKHRSKLERAEAAEAKAQELRRKALHDSLKDHNKVKVIDREIQTLTAANLKNDRWNREADSKILNFQNRVAEWENRKATAAVACAEVKEAIQALRAKRLATIDALAQKELEA